MTFLLLDPPDPSGLNVSTDWWGDITVGQIVQWLVILALLVMVWRKLRPFDNFFRDWFGEKERPGVAARPGMMERMERVEEHLKDAPTRSEFTALSKQVDENTAVLRFIAPAEVARPIRRDDPDA